MLPNDDDDSDEGQHLLETGVTKTPFTGKCTIVALVSCTVCPTIQI